MERSDPQRALEFFQNSNPIIILDIITSPLQGLYPVRFHYFNKT